MNQKMQAARKKKTETKRENANERAIAKVTKSATKVVKSPTRASPRAQSSQLKDSEEKK